MKVWLKNFNALQSITERCFNKGKYIINKYLVEIHQNLEYNLIRRK